MASLDFRSRLTALDGLRGFAILAVFFYHYAGSLGTHASSIGLRVLSVAFSIGWSGVDLFFVLSGFLITGILFDTQNDEQYYRKFYTRRALRIFPIYYLTLLLLVLFAFSIGVHWRPADSFFLIYLGYPAVLIWPSLANISPLIRITHLWSVSMEEQYYMVWPWVIAKLRSPNSILKCCAFLAALSLVLRTLVWASGSQNMAWSYAFLPCRLDQLALGAAIAVLVRGPLQQRLQQFAPIVLIVGTLSMVIICWTRHTVDHGDAVIGTIGYTVLGAVYGSLLTLCLRTGSWLQRIFSLRILRVFGKYSYGLYLYHFPLSVVLSPMKEFFVAKCHSFILGSTVHIIVCLLVNLIVAAASFRWFEAPIMRLKDRFRYSGEGEPILAQRSA